MALIDHFASNAGESSEGGNGFTRISGHKFFATLNYAHDGNLGTPSEAVDFIVNEFGISKADKTDVEFLRGLLSGKPGDGDFARYRQRMEDAVQMYTAGIIKDKSQADAYMKKL